MVPWKTLASIATAEGQLQLRQRGAREFLITIDGRCLMTSSERASEVKAISRSPATLVVG
jgi:hypothetical protein